MMDIVIQKKENKFQLHILIISDTLWLFNIANSYGKLLIYIDILSDDIPIKQLAIFISIATLNKLKRFVANIKFHQVSIP